MCVCVCVCVPAFDFVLVLECLWSAVTLEDDKTSHGGMAYDIGAMPTKLTISYG